MEESELSLSAYVYLTEWYGLGHAFDSAVSFHAMAREFAKEYAGQTFGGKNDGLRFDETIHAFILDRYGLEA